MLSEDTNHANSASGLPGGPRRPDGQMDVEISTGAVDQGRWETESTGSQVRIVKTTVVCAEWEDVGTKDGRLGESKGGDDGDGEVTGGEATDGIEVVGGNRGIK
jgi:hypothetical protein